MAVVADDEMRLRRTGAALEEHGLVVTAQVSSPAELALTDVDAVVVFVDRLGDEKLRNVRAVRKLLPGSRLVCVASSATARDVREAFSAGVDGFVVEDDLEGRLPQAVRAACAGQLSVPREFRALFAKPAFSAREKQILGMVVMGFSNAEIAGRLYLAESTVKSHLSSAFTKLGVRSRGEAASMILDAKAGLGAGILAISGDGGETEDAG